MHRKRPNRGARFAFVPNPDVAGDEMRGPRDARK
jgi:hypothetical protein